MSLRRLARTTRTVVAALTIAGTAATTLGVGSAGAINPNQTTFSGVVNVLGGLERRLDRQLLAAELRRLAARLPGTPPGLLRHAGQPRSGPHGVRRAPSVNNSFWCPSDGTIYLDTTAGTRA